MDFASLMSAEISKSTPKPSTSTSTSSPSTPTTESSTKKYLKRAELEVQRQQAYLDSQAALNRDREAKLTQKRKLDEEAAARNAERDEKRRRLAEESRVRREEEEAKRERARRKRLGLPELPHPNTLPTTTTTASEKNGFPPSSEPDIPDQELIAKLRALSEPATLFGETHPQRLHRYRKLTSAASAAAAAAPQTLSGGPIPTTLALLPESALKINPSLPPASPSPERTYLYRQLGSYFTLLLSAWSSALSSRPAATATSTSGRQAHSAYVSSVQNMTPLFRLFEAESLSDAILGPMVEIVAAAQERRYVDANDGYLRLSIGKAAWPIGVTMVGIHERSAREKLHESDNAAHIMSDEVTRKFLQSIKRCLSFAQTRWPPEDLMQLMG